MKATQDDIFEMFDAIIMSSIKDDATLAEAMEEAEQDKEELISFLRDTRNGLGFVDITWEKLVRLTAPIIKRQTKAINENWLGV